MRGFVFILGVWHFSGGYLNLWTAYSEHCTLLYGVSHDKFIGCLDYSTITFGATIPILAITFGSSYCRTFAPNGSYYK